MRTALHLEFSPVIPDSVLMALRSAMTHGRKIGVRACLAWLGMLGVVTVSLAADFNCARASTAVEKAICADQKLSGLDEMLGMAYRNAVESAGDETQAVREAQRAWLAERNACGSMVECLRKSYDRRLTALLDQHGDTSDAVLMRCDGHSETVSIRPFIGSDTHEPVQTVQVAKGEVQTLVLTSSDLHGECRFASGMEVRGKVGDNSLWPFGQCGADPGAFFSLWLNRVKVASGANLYTACHAAELIRAVVSRQGLRSCYKGDESGCEFTPFKSPLGPRDLEEYPDGPKTEPGSYVIEYSADAQLCRSMVFMQKSANTARTSWSIAPPAGAEAAADSSGDYFSDVAATPPTVQISEFDMNNDGKLESVVSIRYGTKFRRSDTFLAQKSKAVEKAGGDSVDADYLRKHESLLRKQTSLVFPHAWNRCKGGGDLDGTDDGDCRIPLTHYKPKGRVFAYNVTFLSLLPFRFDDTTYFLGASKLLGDEAEESRIITVWKPQPSGAAKEICIFRKIVQNF